MSLGYNGAPSNINKTLDGSTYRDERQVDKTSIFFFTLETEQATSGICAFTDKLTEPHFTWEKNIEWIVTEDDELLCYKKYYNEN